MSTIKSVGTTGSVNGTFIVKSNVGEVLDALYDVCPRVLTMIGIKAEKYAKGRCPVGTPESTGIKGYRGGTLRNSITFEVESSGSGGTVSIGSNVEYAPYVELGTGPFFEAPPPWLEFVAAQGSGGGFGYVRPRPYLKPAITDHLDMYKKIIETELRSTGA